MNGQKPREIAVRVLGQRRPGGEFTENLLDRALDRAALSPADRGLCQELVMGVVRWQATLDWLIERKAPGRTQKLELQNLLRLGLYQIFWLDRIPPHAAVHETVEQAKRSGFGPQAGFINAVLRGYLREAAETEKILGELKSSQPALGWSHPEWLVQRWQQRFPPPQMQALLAWNNTPAKTYARLNTLRTDATRLIEQWRTERVDYDFFTRDWTGENLVFELKSHPSLTTLKSFRDGWFYLQDPSTLLAVRELDPQPGEAILDLCAAPGGKTTFIAQLARNECRVIAQDASPARLKFIEENCARLGVTCVQAIVGDLFRPHPDPLPREKEQRTIDSDNSSAPQASSGSESSNRWRTILPLPGGEGQGEGESKPSSLPTTHFDKVLVDAPCSNTGVLRRRVDLRWRLTPEEIARLSATQLDLLAQAAPTARPGGRLIYSTCSLEPEENREVVQKFLAGHPEFKLERERELQPMTDGVDGAFVSRLRRV